MPVLTDRYCYPNFSSWTSTFRQTRGESHSNYRAEEGLCSRTVHLSTPMTQINSAGPQHTLRFIHVEMVDTVFEARYLMMVAGIGARTVRSSRQTARGTAPGRQRGILAGQEGTRVLRFVSSYLLSRPLPCVVPDRSLSSRLPYTDRLMRPLSSIHINLLPSDHILLRQ